MNNILKRIFFAVVSTLLALSFVSCGEVELVGGNSVDDATFTPTKQETEAVTLEFDIDFEPVDLLSYFDRREGTNAVESDNYSVSQGIFNVIFNLVLYHQLTVGDSEYEEYAEYFESGAIDPEGSIESQMLPSGLYWYADTRAKAMMICFRGLRYLEYAKANDIFPISSFNKVFVEKEAKKISDGRLGYSSKELCGEDAHEMEIKAALLLKEYSDDPSMLTLDDNAPFSVDYPVNFSVDEYLLPTIAPAFSKKSS